MCRLVSRPDMKTQSGSSMIERLVTWAAEILHTAKGAGLHNILWSQVGVVC